MATPTRVPQEIIEEIFLRLPVKSLLRFTSASKSWCCLICSYPFAKSHFNIFQRSSNNLIRTQNILLSMDGDVKFLRDSEVTFGDETAALVRLDFQPKRPNKALKILDSCNGLVVVAPDSKNLFIWNPLIGHYRKLPDPSLSFDRPADFYSRMVCGFGYESSSDDYKLFVGTLKRPSKYQAEIFSLRKNSWKIIKNPPSAYMSFCHYPGTRRRCAFVSGALHWRLPSINHNIASRPRGIVAFDLKTEKFRRVQTKPDIDCPVSLSVLEGKLCVITSRIWPFYEFITTTSSSPWPFELWVMEEYGNKDSWTRLFSFKIDNSISHIPVWISKRSILFEKPSVCQLIRYVSEEGNFKEFQICNNFPWSSRVIAFTETLFSPNFNYILSPYEQKMGHYKSFGKSKHSLLSN